MIVSAIRLFLLCFWAMSYFFIGVLLIPFGLAGKFYNRVSGYFGRDLLKICGGKPIFNGLDKLDPSESYIFVGNHQSYVDIFLIQTALQKKNIRPLFMVKEELYWIPLFKTLTKQMGLIPIARGESKKSMKSVIDALKTLKKGYSVAIFPEGSRTTTGDILPFKRGAFVMAERSGKAIVPYVISGNINIFPKGKLRITGGACSITFLDPIPHGEFSAKELASKVEQSIKEQYEIDRKVIDLLWQK